MNARGNSQEVEAAKGIIINSVVGIIIILTAYSISYFIISTIESTTP